MYFFQNSYVSLVLQSHDGSPGVLNDNLLESQDVPYVTKRASYPNTHSNVVNEYWSSILTIASMLAEYV